MKMGHKNFRIRAAWLIVFLCTLFLSTGSRPIALAEDSTDKPAASSTYSVDPYEARTYSTDATTSDWVQDRDVTAAGQGAARASALLDWALSANKDTFNAFKADQDDSSTLSLYTMWRTVNYISMLIFMIILVAIGFGRILRTDWGVKSVRLIPMILIYMVLANVSFFIGRGIVTFIDKVDTILYSAVPDSSATDTELNAEKLMAVSIDYQEFIGYRKWDVKYEDSVQNELALLKINTYTDYALAGVIILRILVIWALIIFLPLIFPLMVFPPTKKIAVVWFREYARWLLYAPMLILFLVAIPTIWSNSNVSTNESDTNKIYHIGTNIILTAPGLDTSTTTSSTTTTGTMWSLGSTSEYARFITGIMMIWVAILLPLLLLRVAMSMVAQYSPKMQSYWQKTQLAQITNRFIPQSPQPAPTPSPGSAIDATRISTTNNTNLLTRLREEEIKAASEPVKSLAGVIAESTQRTIPVPRMLEMVNISHSVPEITLATTIPEVRNISDIAKVETNPGKLDATNRLIAGLRNSDSIDNPEERERYRKLANDLNLKAKIGDYTAQKVQSAVTNNNTKIITARANEELRREIIKQAMSRIVETSQNIENAGSFNAMERDQKQTNIANDIKTQAAKGDQRAIAAQGAVSQIQAIAKEFGHGRDDQAAGNIEALMKKIAQPQTITNPDEGRQFGALHDMLVEEQRTNKDSSLKDSLINLAEIAQINGKIPSDDVNANLDANLTREYLEQICQDDAEFNKTVEIWQDHYINTPFTPSPKFNDKNSWLEGEATKLDELLNNLLSPQPEIRQKALDEVKTIMPFLLIGGYSMIDIAKYLLAKLKAAKNVIGHKTTNASQVEDKEEVVDKDVSQTVEPKTMAMAEEDNN